MSSPIPASPAPGAVPAVVAEGRQCGRCRGWFDADPEVPAVVPAEWWACPPCRIKILG